MEFTVVAKEVKLIAIHKGIRIHQYLDDWLVRAKSHRFCLQHTQDLIKMCHELGWLVNSEKQVHLGQIHTRPIQWHLKNNWRVSESLEKVIPIPKSLHPHLQWWLEEGNVLTGQQLHPIRHALQIFTHTSKERWGAHLNEHTTRGTWSLPESKLHINYLELKHSFWP